MDAFKINIITMLGMIRCLYAQGKMNKGLFSVMTELMNQIQTTAQAYTKPRSKASFSEVEEYVNKHINMADTAMLETELHRRQQVKDSLKV